MILYELINPSDQITFEAKDKEIAALAVSVVSMAYGAQALYEDGVPLTDVESYNIPIFVFSGEKEVEDYWNKNFGRQPTEALNARTKDLTEVLDSFLIASASERKLYKRTIELLAPDKVDEFKSTWHEEKITSLNDIVSKAHGVSALIKESMQDEKQGMSVEIKEEK